MAKRNKLQIALTVVLSLVLVYLTFYGLAAAKVLNPASPSSVQTPWVGNVDGGGFDLTNVGTLVATTVSSTNINVGTLTISAAVSGLTNTRLVFTDGGNLSDNSSITYATNTAVFSTPSSTITGKLSVGTASISDTTDTLLVSGDVDFEHTAASNDDHAFEMNVDYAGFGDVKAQVINITTGAVSTGEDEEGVVINLDQTDATGGHFAGFEVIANPGGLDDIFALEAGALVGPVFQLVGTFGDMDFASTTAGGNVLADFTTTTTNVTLFASNNDTVLIGDANKFGEISFVLATPASGAGIVPTFEYSSGTTFVAFSPGDGTNGMRNTGVIIFDDDTVPNWSVGHSSNFYIRITRTQVGLGTAPIESIVQISAVTEFKWDLNAFVEIASLNITGTSTFAGVPTFSAFSPGSIPFFGASGILLQDNSNLFWNDSSNRLGIGTTTPSQALVVGNNNQFTVNTTGDVVMASSTVTRIVISGDEITDFAGAHLTVVSGALDLDSEILTNTKCFWFEL